MQLLLHFVLVLWISRFKRQECSGDPFPLISHHLASQEVTFNCSFDETRAGWSDNSAVRSGLATRVPEF